VWPAGKPYRGHADSTSAVVIEKFLANNKSRSNRAYNTKASGRHGELSQKSGGRRNECGRVEDIQHRNRATESGESETLGEGRIRGKKNANPA